MVNSRVLNIMGTRKKILLLAAALMMAAVLWALPSTGSAWMSWSGVDPVIELSNGHIVAIRVDVPTENGCDLTGITVNVTLPEGVSAVSVKESSDDLGCGVVGSVTTVTNGPKRGKSKVTHVEVTVITHSATTHATKIMASVDGDKFKQIARGDSNTEVSGRLMLK
ncbi:MAG: hypothetical protein FJ320_02775 [SAR202 cluster bacterium]|nr:hypothetical protein [SAR202 cluster bacterium]